MESVQNIKQKVTIWPVIPLVNFTSKVWHPPQPINQKNMCVDKNMHMNIDNYTILMDKMCKQTQPN